MTIFLTADWHLGDDRWELMSRPFDSMETYIDTLVANHNKLVQPTDLVYVNGDVLYQKADPQYLKHIARFNGVKILTRGNHDTPFSDEQFSPYFQKIIPEGVGIEVKLGGVECYIQHYPSLAVKNKWNIVGHIHSSWKVQLNSLNVGVDVNHFYPVSEHKVPFFLSAVTAFYDYDVWSAYLPANQEHFVERGKKSYYFTPLDK